MKPAIDASKVTFDTFRNYVTDNREKLKSEGKLSKQGKKCPLNCPLRSNCRDCSIRHLVASVDNSDAKFVHMRKIYRAIPFLRKPMAFVRFELHALGIYPLTCPMPLKNTIDHLEDYAFVHKHLSDEISKQIYALRLLFSLTSSYNCTALAYSLSGPQYFDSCISYTAEECFVDCGAYTGDTLQDFLNNVGKPKRYFAFEPDEKNIVALKNTIQETGLQDSVTVLPYGVYNEAKRMSFVSNGSSSSITEEAGSSYIDLVRMDDVINEPVTTIKMDIEGAELSALQGAERIIREYHPKLAICIYHSATDLW